MGISVTNSVNLSNETMANLVLEAAHLKQRVYKLVGFVVLWAISMLDYRKEDSEGDCDLRPHAVPDSKTVSKPRKRKAGGMSRDMHLLDATGPLGSSGLAPHLQGAVAKSGHIFCLYALFPCWWPVEELRVKTLWRHPALWQHEMLPSEPACCCG